MRTAVLALVGAAAASAQMLQNWVPGICGAGSLTPTVGVGCGVLGSDLKMVSATWGEKATRATMAGRLGGGGPRFLQPAGLQARAL